MAHQCVVISVILFFGVVNISGHSIGHHYHHQHYGEYDDYDYDEWGPHSSKHAQRHSVFHVVYPSKDFSYTNNGGSKNWPATFRDCGGTHQSPINIQTRHVYPSTTMPILTFQNYWDNENIAVMNNSGKRVDIMLDGERKMPTIYGGPLPGEYEFVELHFHWGQNDSEGSEHSVNSQMYPMEAHLVHFKKEYGDVKFATKHQDGIAVIAFFFQIDTAELKDFSELVADLRLIRKANSAVDMSSASAGLHWINSAINGPYFTYAGSLTTPPCSEVVTWIIYQRPVTISRRQMQEFRKLESPDGHKITNNHRNMQRYVQPHVVAGSNQPEAATLSTSSPLRRSEKSLHSPPSIFHHSRSSDFYHRGSHSHHSDFLPHWFRH